MSLTSKRTLSLANTLSRKGKRHFIITFIDDAYTYPQKKREWFLLNNKSKRDIRILVSQIAILAWWIWTSRKKFVFENESANIKKNLLLAYKMFQKMHLDRIQEEGPCPNSPSSNHNDFFFWKPLVEL